jgi:hypothetical protein
MSALEVLQRAKKVPACIFIPGFHHGTAISYVFTEYLGAPVLRSLEKGREGLFRFVPGGETGEVGPIWSSLAQHSTAQHVRF